MADGMINFYNIAQQREFARAFQFRVVTLGPLTQDDLVYLRTANLPEKEISNQQVPYMGFNFNIPGAVIYSGSAAWPVTFLADEAMNIRSKLEAWMTEIFDIQTSSGKYGVPTEIASLELLDKSFKAIRKYNLIGCYCQKVDPLAYDIKDPGKPQEFNAIISYQYWQQV